MFDPNKYNINIRQVEVEGVNFFEARIKELPDVAEYGDSFEEAYNLAIDSIVTTAEIFAEKGKAMPAPFLPVEEFSGRVTLRINKSLHRLLSETSEDEGVSLNQHICNILNVYAGTHLAKQDVSTVKPNSIQTDSVIVRNDNRHLKLVSKTDRPLAAANEDWR